MFAGRVKSVKFGTLLTDFGLQQRSRVTKWLYCAVVKGGEPCTCIVVVFQRADTAECTDGWEGLCASRQSASELIFRILNGDAGGGLGRIKVGRFRAPIGCQEEQRTGMMG